MGAAWTSPLALNLPPLSRLWRWEPKRWTALGQAPGRKRVLLLGAVPVGVYPGLPCDATERSSKCRLPGFLSPSLCPKERCPGCFPTTRGLPSLLSPPNHPTGQRQNLTYSTGCPQDLFHKGRGRLRGFLELRRPWGFSPEARRGSQGASSAAPGKSGLPARSEEERVVALE